MARLLHTLILSVAVAGRLLAAGAGASELSAAGDPLRLPEAVLPGLQPLIDRALAASPRVLQGRLAVLAAEAGAREARAALAPHISVGAGADGRQEIRQDLPGVHYSFKYSYGIGASESLWSWGALENRARIGEIQRSLAENDLAEARRNLVVELRAQYTGLVVRARELAQARWGDRRRAEQLQRDEQRGARGEVPALDLADERLAVQESRLTVERLALAWDHARGDFAVLIGEPDFTGEDLPKEIPAAADWAAGLRPPEAGAGNGAVAAKTAVPAALARVDQEREAARLGVEVERVRQRPTVDLVAGLTQDEVSYTANTASKFGAEISYIGFRINWNIFDGHASEAATARARADLKQKILAYDLAAAALQRSLVDGWKDLELAQRELAVMEARFAQAAARLAADEARKDAGQIAAEDWQQRLFDQAQSQVALLRARASQLLRVAEYALLRERSTVPAANLHFP